MSLDSRRSNREKLEEFIDLYKQLPCLWQVKGKEYHDRDKKNAAYNQLVNVLKEVEPDANRESVIKKINTYRTNYRKERKKVENSKKSGAGNNDVYVPTLWYYDKLHFVRDQETPRTSQSNLTEECTEESTTEETERAETENSENIIDNNTSDCDAAANISTRNTDDITTPKKTPVPATRPGRKKINEQDQLTTDILLSVKDHFKRPASAIEDRYDLLGRSIAIKLRSLDKRQRLIAEKIINDTLFDAEMGNLNTESIQNHRSLTFISSPTPSFSRTPSPSPSLIQQYNTQPFTHAASVVPQTSQPYVFPIQQYNNHQQSYTISSAPQSQPCASPIQQYNTQHQPTSPAVLNQASSPQQEELDTQLTTATFYSNFNSELT